MDAIGFITGRINAAVLIFALAIFAARGLWQPWQDNEPFVRATVKHNPKLQCACLAVIGFGLIGTGGTIGSSLNEGRTWIIDAATDSTAWALGGLAALAVAVAGVLIWIDYIVPGGLEPGKPAAHMTMWGISLMLWPLMQLALGVVSLLWFAVFYVLIWIFNAKFRRGKPAATPAGTRQPVAPR